jgi:acyl carrier protein
MTKREDYAARLKELVNQLAEDDADVEVDSDLVDDVGLSSIEIMELIEQLEDEYDISFPLNDLAEIRTITDMAKELERLVTQQ